jgi:hypothetical protein
MSFVNWQTEKRVDKDVRASKMGERIKLRRR